MDLTLKILLSSGMIVLKRKLLATGTFEFSKMVFLLNVMYIYFFFGLFVIGEMQ